MATVYGIANHGPEQTMLWLQKETKNKKMTLLSVGELLTKKKEYNKNIIIISVADFLRNLPRINHAHFEDNNFFIHASVVRLSEISGVIPTDYQQDATRKSIFHLHRQFLPNILKSDPAKVEKGCRKYLPLLIEDVRRSGFLDKIMTFIYTLPSATHQKPITSLICTWLYEGLETEDIDKLLNKLKSDIRIVDKLRSNLYKHLTSGVAGRIQDAFVMIKEKRDQGQSAPIDVIATKHNVSAYDLRYILSKIKQKEDFGHQEKITIDELVKNRGV